jgi:hypothetical protein
MEERRKTPRIKEENEITITVVSGENNFPKEKIIDNFTKDISAGGAKIQTNILLPVDSLIELEFASKGLRQQISSLGKVKWVKVLIEDESYEAGLEFSGDPSDALKKLEDYISWKLKSNKAELIKKKLSPMYPDIAETKEQPIVDSVDINKLKTKEPSPVEPVHTNNVKTKERLPIKSTRWIKVAVVGLFAISAIIILSKISGLIPAFDSATMPVPPIVAQAPKAIQTPASVTIPTQDPEVTETPTPETSTTPVTEVTSILAQEETKKIKVIGNSDSKRYHLPGMKYYNAVKVYHRVEFDSEADAIKAGYNKAPQ